MSLLAECLGDIKKSIHTNYNDNCQIARILNITTNNSKRDVGSIKSEMIEELDLREIQSTRMIEKNAQLCREREQAVFAELEASIAKIVEERGLKEKQNTKDWIV